MKQIVLMYHDVYKVNPLESGFKRERDLPYKLEYGLFFNHVQAIADYCDANSLSKESIVFTFDDGGSSFYSLIAPLLSQFGFCGHFYISTKHIGSDGFLNVDDIKGLERNGHIVGSHAHTHEHLYNLTEEQVKKEWVDSVSILSDILDHTINEASIPNGDSSEIVLNAMNIAGLKEIYTSRPTTKKKIFNDMTIHGRYVVLSNTSVDEVLRIIQSPFSRFVLDSKWLVISVIKRLLGDNYVKLKNLIYRNR